MAKAVWIIAHDSVLDHRLFFFERFFKERGCAVNLIAGPFVFEGYGSFERKAIIRPEVKKTVHDFEVSGRYPNMGLSTASNVYIMLKILIDIAKNCNGGSPLDRKIIKRAFASHFKSKSYAFAFDQNKLYLRFEVPGRSHDIDFDSETGQIREITRIPYDNNFVFSNYSFKLLDFLDKVYNFSSIYRKIEMALSDKTLTKPDLIYVADLPTLPIAIEYKKKFQVPLVLDCHEWWKEQYKIWGDGNHEKENLFDQFEKELYGEADLLLTVGKQLASYMSEYFKMNFNCVYTCDSIGHKKSQERHDFWRKEIEGYNGEKILLFQGSITPQRNLDTMVEIAKDLSEGILLVVCGDGSYREPLLRKIREVGAENKIKYLGWQNQERLLDFTNYADAGFIPYVAKSRYYSCGAPNKLFEFISAKLPIVYHDSMLEIDNIVRENGFGIPINYLNTEEAAKQISIFLKSSEDLDVARKNYETKGDQFFYDGQSKVFTRLLSEKAIFNI